jgi:hypothetical protein
LGFWALRWGPLPGDLSEAKPRRLVRRIGLVFILLVRFEACSEKLLAISVRTSAALASSPNSLIG